MKKKVAVPHATPQKPCSPSAIQHLAHTLAPSYRTLLFLLAAGMFLFSCNEDIELSSEATITSLTLTVVTVGSKDYEVTFTGTQYTLRVGPLGTPIPATVGVKNIVLSSGATTDAGDQLAVTNNAVTLTVTAADGKTQQKYTVTLGFTTVGITSFTFEVPGNESMALDTADHKRIVGKIDHETGTITFDRQSAYVYRDKLKATFEVSEEGAAVQVAGADQESGVTEQDFTSSVAYAVRAPGGTETTTYRVTLAKSTLATIPDDSFRAKLKELVSAAFTEDQLDITHSDVIDYSRINVDNSFNQIPKLTSLKGIEFFTALTYLSCASNRLTSLDVSGNVALTYLSCGSNLLTSLDVSGNTALDTLYCSSNALTSLDVSANTALTSLSCGDSDLTSLNVTRNTALMDLECSNNDLTSLDVTGNTALTSLRFGFNKLTSLDVTENTALTSLECSSNSLASLDVRENTALKALYCISNSLTSLDVSANTALALLNCQGNSLTSLDMTGMRSVAFFGALNIGTGAGTANRLETLRVNIMLQDRTEIITMKTNRGEDLTITTVTDAGEEDCANYAPKAVALGGGKCN